MREDLKLTLTAWNHAGTALGIRVEAPYCATGSDGTKVTCVAHLPDFGSPNGMLVGVAISPRSEVEKDIKRVAMELGKYYSFININFYAKYDDEVFKEALIDWGFWGISEQCPLWLRKIP